jgi:transmembrane sensor
MRVNSDRGDRVTEEAARWLGLLLDGNGGSSEFFAWLEESPRHVEEFLFVLADAQDLAALSPAQRLGIEELSRTLGSDASESNVVPFPSETASEPKTAPTHDVAGVPTASGRARVSRKPLIGWSLGIAASLFIAIGAAWWLDGPGAWTTYTTEVGEQRAVELADGSVVHLNTDSAVSVRMTDSARDVRLVRGEALFSVERDPGRPFLVRTSNAVIQAIGTRFNVYSRADRTQVAVIEGLVQLSNRANTAESSPASSIENSGSSAVAHDAESNRPTASAEFVGAGETADVSRTGKVSHPRAVDPVKAVAWRQRRLVFEDDSLGEIAAEFNRYNATVKIRVVGDAATAERFSGTFDADAPEAMMQALAGDSTFRVERVENDIVISPRLSE